MVRRGPTGRPATDAGAHPSLAGSTPRISTCRDGAEELGGDVASDAELGEPELLTCAAIENAREDEHYRIHGKVRSTSSKLAPHQEHCGHQSRSALRPRSPTSAVDFTEQKNRDVKVKAKPLHSPIRLHFRAHLDYALGIYVEVLRLDT